MRSTTVFIILMLLGFAALVWAYPYGPPDGKTGAPGEGLCTDVPCHTSFPANSGDGSLSLDGISDQYVADSTYTLTVILSDLGQSRWGFELAVKDAANQQAGTITVADAVNTQLSTSGGISYLKHTTTGTYAGTTDGPVSWIFEWTAPSSNIRKVHFYIAGNAANNNSFNTGDYIYNISVEIDAPTDVEESFNPENQTAASNFTLSQNHPNPFNLLTVINYYLPEDCKVKLTVYNLLGEEVKILVDRYQFRGQKTAHWNGKDGRGFEVSSGVYFLKIQANEFSESKCMLLLK